MSPSDPLRPFNSVDRRQWTAALEVWIDALAGRSIRSRWQPTRDGPVQPGGNMATTQNAQALRPILGELMP